MSMGEILNYLQGTSDIAVALRLILATVLGSLVGWERIATHHSAGIKTFSLVSLGSAVATSLNIYLAMMPGLTSDAARISAGVVNGIGFLGAGTILVTGRKQIKGLSTAATLWVTACMGMAIGAGYLAVGITAFILIVFTNIVLLHLSNSVESHSQYLSIYIEVSKERGVTELHRFISEKGFVVMSMNKSKDKTILPSDTGLIINLKLDSSASHHEILKLFNKLDYVTYVEEV
ncbi:MgtC/SapB family protein [Butyrivibrio sp. AE3006]|uniref:MgtC/SapB family protein n=1 Tax=Butyrivibrio sp. AE3006 TaxID=1280673 RepID=UPI00041F5B6B|nr:MgtC/SapB family protein [Butyrivibrio sp. AE3006]